MNYTNISQMNEIKKENFFKKIIDFCFEKLKLNILKYVDLTTQFNRNEK